MDEHEEEEGDVARYARLLQQPHEVVGVAKGGHSPVGLTVVSADHYQEQEHDFCGAIRLLRDGKTVKRREWQDDRIMCRMVEGNLCILNGVVGDGKWHAWIVSDGDMDGEDWVEVEP